ncbi:MAG: 16S rRNA (cytidine(1402)-2'-O)-methyltransferase [Bryobacterales bacterium]|nr:16S rRNA (cytidine(1402)-2'-O)-methyltransferase [Bryobacterales bacterium]
MAAGTIYLVATPLGNLEDITLRALRVLGEVDLIACEDTRHTGKLLKHFHISKPLLSFHEHNESVRASDIVEQASGGESIAVVTDAGMPGISDPGYRLVAKAIAAGVVIVPIPGPVALVTALVASGLPTGSFRFGGFLPAKATQRRKTLQALIDDTATLVFYEAPHRIVNTLQDVLEILGDRRAVIARELTKVHEEFLRGSVSHLLATLDQRGAVRGEITLLIGRGESPRTREGTIADRVDVFMSQGAGRMGAVKQVAKERGLSKREVYRLLEEQRRR